MTGSVPPTVTGRAVWPWLALMGGLAGVDLATKWVVARLLPLHGEVVVIPGLFSLFHTRNTGIAFSLFAGEPSVWRLALLVGAGCLALAWVVWTLWREAGLTGTARLAVALIGGGVIGNTVERLLTGGMVTDFLDFHWGDGFAWPTFNAADSWLTIGAVLLGLHILRQTDRERAG